MSDQTSRFQQVLDECHDWPCPYTFKFIVPQQSLSQIEKLFPEHDIQKRESKTGKYTSITVEISADSSDIIVAIYQKAALIPGVMAL